MPTPLKDYIEEVRSTGRIANLPTQSHIAGKSTPARNNNTIPIFDPGRAEAFAEIYAADEEEVEQAISAARSAFRNTSQEGWGQSTPAERAKPSSNPQTCSNKKQRDSPSSNA